MRATHILHEAFHHSHELMMAQLAIEEGRQNLLVAHNAMLHKLDLFARRDFDGVGGALDDSVDQLTDNKFGSWTLGVQAQMPLGANKESAAVQRALLQIAQAKEVLRDKGRELEHRLAQSFAEVEARSELHNKAVAMRMEAAKRLEAQKLLHEQGKIEIDRLLDAVRKYADAVTTEVFDKARYQIAIANLEAAKGTLLEYDNIRIHEGPWPAQAYEQAAARAEARRRAIELPRKSEPGKATHDEHGTLHPYDNVEGFTPKDTAEDKPHTH